jgi:hypothetical protein
MSLSPCPAACETYALESVPSIGKPIGLPPDLPRLTRPFRQSDLAACVAEIQG